MTDFHPWLQWVGGEKERGRQGEERESRWQEDLLYSVSCKLGVLMVWTSRSDYARDWDLHSETSTRYTFSNDTPRSRSTHDALSTSDAFKVECTRSAHKNSYFKHKNQIISS